jgi:hypothetical protein
MKLETTRRDAVLYSWTFYQKGTGARPVAARPSKGKGVAMARGDKSKYTDKQKRKAEHIEEGYEKRVASKEEAERRAWATVNKSSGGGKKSGSGKGKKENKGPSKKGGKKGAAAQPNNGTTSNTLPVIKSNLAGG